MQDETLLMPETRKDPNAPTSADIARMLSEYKGKITKLPIEAAALAPITTWTNWTRKHQGRKPILNSFIDPWE